MSLHDTESLSVETGTAAESLPDPTTVSGRTHDLTNNASVSVVWSSVGATPFTDASGVNQVTITVLRGDTVRVQSDGTRWKIIPLGNSARRIFAAVGTTDGSGNVTFTFTPAFPSVPVVQGQMGVTATTDLTELVLTAVSASSCTFRARRAPAVTILGISVITFPINAAGLQIQCTAVTAGQGV